MNAGRVYAIAARKFASLRRDKRMFGFIVLMPAIQILLFGIAIGQAPTGLDFGVIDECNNGFVTLIIDELHESESLVIHTDHATITEARYAIAEGELWGALLIPENGSFELHLDNSNQQISSTIIVEVRNAMSEVLSAGGGSVPLELAEPVYGQKDQDGTIPTDLDAANGHATATADYPDGIYHYHIILVAPYISDGFKGTPGTVTQ